MIGQLHGRWLQRIWHGLAGVPTRPVWPSYTAPEVKQALRQPPPGRRGERINECLAHILALLDEGSIRHRFRGLEDYYRCLPRILTLYGRGYSAERIATELSLFATGVGIERAIDTAALVMAESLNRQVMADGRPGSYGR